MGLFKRNKKKATIIPAQKPAPARPKLPSKYDFDVKSWDQLLKNMMSVLELNPNYKEPKSTEKTVYKYKYFEKECELIPEPKNKYDKDAIKVCYGGVHIGYVPAAWTDDVKKLMKAGYKATLSIRPGHYKKFEDDEWVTYKKDPYAFVVMTYDH